MTRALKKKDPYADPSLLHNLLADRPRKHEPVPHWFKIQNKLGPSLTPIEQALQDLDGLKVGLEVLMEHVDKAIRRIEKRGV